MSKFCPHLLFFFFLFLKRDQVRNHGSCLAFSYSFISISTVNVFFLLKSTSHVCSLKARAQSEPTNSQSYKTAHKVLRFSSDRLHPKCVPSLNNLCISCNILRGFQIYAHWFHVKNFYWSFVFYITNAEEIFIEIYKVYFKMLDQIIKT